MAATKRDVTNKWRNPTGRHDHSTAVVKEDVFLWAGRPKGSTALGETDMDLFKSSVEVYNVNTGCWKLYSTHGPPPQGEWDYSCVAVEDVIYYFGGRCGKNYYNSVYSLNTSCMQWKMLSLTSSENGVPMKKILGGMVHFVSEEDQDLLYLIGGHGPQPSFHQPGAKYEKDESHVYTNEQHIFSLSTNEWSSLKVIGQSPPPCSAFTITKVGERKAALFGGENGPKKFNSLYVVELRSQFVTWSCVGTPVDKSVQWPQNRCSHAATCVSDSTFVVIGGRNLSFTQSDLWLCDTVTMLWKKLQVPLAESVCGRWRHSVSAVQLGLHCVWLIIFGGYCYIANTAIVELYKGDDGEWSVGRVFKRETLGDSDVYRDMLREGKRKGLPVGDIAATMVKEEEIQHLLKQKLHEMTAEQQLAVKKIFQNQSDCEETVPKNVQATTMTDFQQQDKETGQIINHSQWRLQELEEEYHQLQQQKDQLLNVSSLAIQDANRRNEEAQQRTRELEEENRFLKLQIQQLRDKVAEDEQPHWLVKREEIEITEELVGRGGWGTVKVAEFRGLRVAAKCLDRLIVSPYNIQLFTREMSIAAKLRHPNLLLFIGATREEEPIILTELMPTSLCKELEKGQLIRKHVISISRDVSRGLSYLHLWRPCAILHRDVCSGNVLLEPISTGWRAKVSDYGSANYEDLTATVGPGNPVYAAPEAKYPSQHSSKMDVFSFGILLVAMCLSQSPESTQAKRAAQIERIHWPAMVALIDMCTRDVPADRPSMTDVLSILNLM